MHIMESAEKKSKSTSRIFYAIFALLVIGSVGVTFVKIVMERDYQVVAMTSCSPQSEKCFVSVCDPDSDSTCPTEESMRTTYYKLISKKAAAITLCEATTNKIGCGAELSCTPNEESCYYTYCNPATVTEGESCAE